MRDPKITKRAEQLLALGNVMKAPVPVLELAKRAGVTVKFGALPDELSGFLIRGVARLSPSPTSLDIMLSIRRRTL